MSIGPSATETCIDFRSSSHHRPRHSIKVKPLGPNVQSDQYKHAAISTEVLQCSLLGKEIMQKHNGNAIDAAIAAMLCIGVIDGFSAGLGGGGFALFRNHDGSVLEALDFREAAPSSAYPGMFVGREDQAFYGVRSIAIPGDVKGIQVLHEKYGRSPWPLLFEGAIKLARDGFKVTPELARRLLFFEKDILANPTLRPTYAPKGNILEEGDICKRENLAETLQILADAGNADPFYQGCIKASLMAFIKRMTPSDVEMPITDEDFAEYKVKFRNVLIGTFKSKQIVTVASPASGAVALEALNILEILEHRKLLESYVSNLSAYPSQTSSKGPTPLEFHQFVEVLKHIFSSRSRLFDPLTPKEAKFIAKFESLLDDSDLANFIASRISDERTFPPSYYDLPHHPLPKDDGTAHISVIDSDGMAVSMMSSINNVFGSQLMDPVTGIILNDEMFDFSLVAPKSKACEVPGLWNGKACWMQTGTSFCQKYASASSLADGNGDVPPIKFPPTLHNEPRPGKRPLSSSIPLIVVDSHGRNEMVIGAAGGHRILTAVLQTLWLVYCYNFTLKQSIFFPRVHHQLIPNIVVLEDGYSRNFKNFLRSRGHELAKSPHGLVGSSVHAVRKFYSDKPGGQDYLEAEADPRKGGLAAGY